MDVTKRLGAEFLGTFILVFGGCGSAVLAALFLVGEVQLGIGFVGVSLAFGLTVVGGAYGLGHISGGHFNPAITLGLVASKRFEARDAAPYVIAQTIGAIVAAGVLWVIAMGREGMTSDLLTESGFASNGYDDHSPGLFNLTSAFLIEVVLTAVFLFVVIGITDRRAAKGFAPLAIGLTLTLIHLVSIPVTNTSVNPARSTGPALLMLAGGESWPVEQLWLFWLAPIIGGVLAGVLYVFVAPGEDEAPVAAPEPDPQAA
jgi:aquaporin Z